MGIVPDIKSEKDPLYEKIRQWFALHMTSFATFSVPEFLVEEFENKISLTEEPIHNITPTVKILTCSQCKYKFVAGDEDGAVQCPECGFTTIKE